MNLFRKPTVAEVIKQQLEEARLAKLIADAQVERARADQDALANRVRRLEGLLTPA